MEKFADIVVIKRNGEDGKSFPLIERKCTFGQLLHCDIRIQLPNVSKEHCFIQVDSEGQPWLKDISTNGTLVNGKPIKECILHDKDVFIISDRSFRFEYGRKLMTFSKSDGSTLIKPKTPVKKSFSPVISAKPDSIKGNRIVTTENGDLHDNMTPNTRSTRKSAKKLASSSSSSLTWSISKTNPELDRFPISSQSSDSKKVSYTKSPLPTPRKDEPSVQSSLPVKPTAEMSSKNSSNTKKISNESSLSDDPSRIFTHSRNQIPQGVLSATRKTYPSPSKEISLDPSKRGSTTKKPNTPKGEPIKRSAPINEQSNLTMDFCEESSNEDDRTVPISPSEEMKNRRHHPLDQSIIRRSEYSMVADTNSGSLTRDPMPTPLRIGQITPAKRRQRKQEPDDMILAQSTKFRTELIRTPTSKPIKSTLIKSSASKLKDPRNNEDDISQASISQFNMEEPIKTVSTSNLAMLRAGAIADDDPSSPILTTSLSAGPSSSNKRGMGNPGSSLKMKKLATPIIREINQGIQLKSKLERLKKLATPLRIDIGKGKVLRKTKEFRSLPSPLGQAIVHGIKLKNSKKMKKLATPLKMEIHEGIPLKSTKNFPKLKTPLKQAIENPKKLKSIRPTNRLVTPLKKAIEAGYSLLPTKNYKKLTTPVKNEIMQKATSHSINRRHESLPTKLKEAIEKGADLKKTKTYTVLATPIREDIKKGVPLRKAKQYRKLSTPIRTDIEKGLTLKKTRDFKKFDVSLTTAIKTGVELKKWSRVYPKLSTPLRKELHGGIRLRKSKEFPRVLSTPLRDEIQQGVNLKSHVGPKTENSPEKNLSIPAVITTSSPIVKRSKLPTPLRKEIEQGTILKPKVSYLKLASPLREQLIRKAATLHSAKPLAVSSHIDEPSSRKSNANFTVDHGKRSERAMRHNRPIEWNEDDLKTLFNTEVDLDDTSIRPVELKSTRTLRSRAGSRGAATQQPPPKDTDIIVPPSTPSLRRVTRSSIRATPNTQSKTSTTKSRRQENELLSSENDLEPSIEIPYLNSSSTRVHRSTRKPAISKTTSTMAEETPSSHRRTRKRPTSHMDENSDPDNQVYKPNLTYPNHEDSSISIDLPTQMETLNESSSSATSRPRRTRASSISKSTSLNEGTATKRPRKTNQEDMKQTPSASQESIISLPRRSGRTEHPTSESSHTSDTINELEARPRRKTRASNV